MSSAPELDVDGPAAPPRDNGELAFTAPWQPRTFGVTMTLVDTGALSWGQFRACLVAEIAAHEQTDGFDYWTCWSRALEAVLVDQDLLAPTAVTDRAAALAARPAGHDHGPGAGHGH